MDGIIRIPQSLRHQSRHHLLGDTAERLFVADTEISRTQQGSNMRQERTKEQIAGAIA